MIGDFVYRGSLFPDLKGYYVCVDYNAGEAWKIKSNTNGVWKISKQLNVPKGIAGFGEGDDGELYAISYDSSKIYQVQTTTAFAINEPEEINMPVNSILKPVTKLAVIENRSASDLKKDY